MATTLIHHYKDTEYSREPRGTGAIGTQTSTWEPATGMSLRVLGVRRWEVLCPDVEFRRLPVHEFSYVTKDGVVICSQYPRVSFARSAVF